MHIAVISNPDGDLDPVPHVRTAAFVDDLGRANDGIGNGNLDVITGDLGSDVILGGAAGDDLSGNDGADVILGDFGSVDWVVNDADDSDIDVVSTSDVGAAAADTISGGSGNDLVLGGSGHERIDGGDAAIVIEEGQVKNVVRADD